ncbi:IS3 family transposase [Spiroplasma endosymbiont of Aspidapion aeneum]|uniref:IS3 family transposase n=1 Tax=Spiroplasma endosymbiont of Aspidapion aeneum TaxID=3066276 RepID=UPI003CC7A28A
MDNAAVETFFSQLKLSINMFYTKKTFSDVCMIVDEYIRYYNYERITIKSNDIPQQIFTFPK